MLGFRKIRTEIGFVIVCGHKVVFRWCNYLRLLRRTYAMLRFQEARGELLGLGCALPAEAAPRWTGRYVVDTVRLGDLRRRNFRQLGGELIPLEDSMLVRYLRTKDVGVLAEYERLHVQFGIFPREKMASWRVSALNTFASVERDGYDPSRSCIVVNEDNSIADGYHRLSALYVKHGPMHQVRVIRILGDAKEEGLF